MKTNFQMLRELLDVYYPARRLFASREEVDMIKTMLHINEMDVLQLRNLRDFTVAYMGNSKNVDDLDRMSAITYCIDSQIVELGGEI